MHWLNDAGVNFRHAGFGRPFHSWPCQLGYECGHEHWCGALCSGSLVFSGGMALRLFVIHGSRHYWRSACLVSNSVGLQAAYDNQLQDEEGEPLENASTEQ